MVDETDFKFDDKLRHQIHYDWGKHYKRLGDNVSARKQFLDSLSLKENAHGPTEQLSKCHLERGDTSKALELANQCLKNYPKIARSKYHRNECIYDSNEFETCLVERYRMCNDKSTPVRGSIDAIKMTELTLEESIGNRTGSFLNKFRKAISELDKIEAETLDNRPLWKIRRDKAECDVLSVCSDSNEFAKTQKVDHPLDLYLNRKKLKTIRSMYFSKPTIETYDFLQSLLNDQRLDFPPSEENTQSIRNDIEAELKIFKIFENMLQQRQPIYAKKLLKRRNNKNKKKFDQLALVKTQETIERAAKRQIEKIDQMKISNFPGLLKFVEDIMTNFYLIKSDRVFPKKTELLETIYNIVGISHIEQMQIDFTYNQNSSFAALDSALSYHHGFSIPKRFNLRPGVKNPIDHFLKRLQYTDNSIEKCYILHQLSRLYYEQEKYIESKEMGVELLSVSRSMSNHVWMLLGCLRVMLVDALLGEYDKVKTIVEEVRTWKENVNESVWKFLEKISTTV